MNSPTPQMINCRVIGGDKLPADTGGADALCAAITRAAASDAPNRRFSVEVRVFGSSLLAATLTTDDGRILPEQKLEISDRGFTNESFERFAKVIVGEVARAPSR